MAGSQKENVFKESTSTNDVLKQHKLLSILGLFDKVLESTQQSKSRVVAMVKPNLQTQSLDK